MSKLILIDGNAIMHRAFHALPPLTNKDGKMTNAVYGFFSMFLKILEDQKPQYVVICFDRPKPTFRKELFVGYQAKRPKMSDDLSPQIKMVHEILQKAKVEIFEVDGYEADDLIGTIARQAISTSRVARRNNPKKIDERIANSEELEVLIVSGDRDLLQLVNSHVRMIAPVTGLTNMIVFDEKKVKEKFGIEPSQIVDYKALVGDQSDNYPGVNGIGPKGAANLIHKYRRLEEIYKKIEEIREKNPKLGLNLAEGAEAAALAQKLAKIVTDAPITLNIEKAGVDKLDREGLRMEFETFGFKSLLKRLGLPEKKKVESSQIGLFN
jgi:DNA polymerase I